MVSCMPTYNYEKHHYHEPMHEAEQEPYSMYGPLLDHPPVQHPPVNQL